jgi:hypothetical protein
MEPKALLPFKTLKPFPKVASKVFVDPQGLKHQVEIMGDGQQFVAFGIHPDTQKGYRWDTPLDTVDWDNLPTLSKHQAKEIADVFERKCTKLGWKKWKKKGRMETQPGAGPDSMGQSSTVTNGKFRNDIQEWTNQSRQNPAAPTASQPLAPMPQEPPHGEAKASPLASFAEWDRQQDAGSRLQISLVDCRKALASVPAEELDYQEWVNVGMALYHQFEGDEEGYDLWEEWSAKDAGRFHPEGMPEKWKTFAPEAGRRPVTFLTVLKMAGDRRKENDLLQEYINRYVYIESEDTVHDLYGPPHKPNPILKNFRTRTAGDKKEVLVPAPIKDDPNRMLPKVFPIHVLWNESPERQWVSGETYVPHDGTQPRIVEVGGYRYLNTFRMPEFPHPTKNLETLLDCFFEHMKYLFPVEREREWFIDWMALNVQHPDNRCKVTPLHISLKHGTGRGWLIELMNQLLGSWNCARTKMATIVEGGWGDYLHNTLFCVVDEVHDKGDHKQGYEVAECLREVLTENFLQVNIKYGATGTQRVYTNFLFLSNRADALVLTEDDRRINVFKMIEDKRDAAYYTRLYKWKTGRRDKATGEEIPTDGVCALWHWLMARDLSKFEWQHCMDTEARRQLIGSSENKTEMYFKEIFADHDIKVITVELLKQMMAIKAEAEGEDSFYYESNKIDRQLTKMLEGKGWVAGPRIKVPPKPENFYIE